MCSLFGYSTIKTFDSRLYSFEGACTYKLAGDCQGDSFSVHYHHKGEKKCTNSEQCQRNVTLYASGMVVNLFNVDRVQINKQNISLPYSSSNIAIERLKGTDYVSVTGMRGLTILWNGFSLDVQLLPSFANKTCGMCGNYNGSPKDDFIYNEDGDLAATPDQLGRHWKRLEYGERCSDRKALFTSTFKNRYLSKTTFSNEFPEIIIISLISFILFVKKSKYRKTYILSNQKYR